MFTKTVKNWAITLVIAVLAMMALPASAAPDWFKAELVKAEHFGGDNPHVVYHLRYTNTSKDRIVTKVYSLKLKLCFYDISTRKGISININSKQDNNVTINPGKSVEVKRSVPIKAAKKTVEWINARKEFDLGIKDFDCEVDHKAK